MIVFLFIVIFLLFLGMLWQHMELRNLKRVSHNQSKNINLLFQKLVKIETKDKKFFTNG